jgi:hypothetical protein
MSGSAPGLGVALGVAVARCEGVAVRRRPRWLRVRVAVSAVGGGGGGCRLGGRVWPCVAVGRCAVWPRVRVAVSAVGRGLRWRWRGFVAVLAVGPGAGVAVVRMSECRRIAMVVVLRHADCWVGWWPIGTWFGSGRGKYCRSLDGGLVCVQVDLGLGWGWLGWCSWAVGVRGAGAGVDLG